MKIKERAAAISSAVGLVVGDSCHSRLRRGVMDILESSSPASVAMMWNGSRGPCALALLQHMRAGGVVGGGCVGSDDVYQVVFLVCRG